MPLSPITLNAGRNKTNIDEDELYNPDGIVIHYGYDGRAVYGDEEGYAYSAISQTPGLHSIQLDRVLMPGEEIVLHWRNGYDLIIYNPGIPNRTLVKKRVGGSYQEIGKWSSPDGNSERTCPLFEDDVLTKRFDYIETKNFREF